LRLAVVSPFIDRRHGTERAFAELIERLSRDYGCEVHIYAQRVEDLTLSDPRAPRTTDSGTIIWHRVPSVPGPHLAQFVSWMISNGFLRSWHALFRRTSYDLVLSPGINCLHPDVVIVHALFHRLRELARAEKGERAADAGFFRRAHRRVYYALLSGLERRIYGDARVTLAAASKRTAGLLRDYIRRDDVRVVPNGVDLAYFSPKARTTRRAEARNRRGFRDEDLVLLLIGNDWRTKGLPATLAALAALPRESRPQLLVVGNDSPEHFQASASRLGLQDCCRWETPRSDVLDFYAAADIYVSPTREDCFSLPVLEAMACGLPVITSVFNGVVDCIHDGVDGFVMREPRDAQKLAQIIRRLQADAGLKQNVGAAAAEAARGWSWSRNAEAAWELLKVASAKKKQTRYRKPF